MEQSGFRHSRLRNITGVRDKTDKILNAPAVYMQKHKNHVGKPVKAKLKSKPVVIVGSLEKPNIDYTADLSIMAHRTSLIKKKMRESSVVAS